MTPLFGRPARRRAGARRLRGAGLHAAQGVRSSEELGKAPRDVSLASPTLERDQEPEDVVGAVVCRCGRGATFVTGQTMGIDGGPYVH